MRESERKSGKEKATDKNKGRQKRKGEEKDWRKNNQEEKKRKRQVKGVKRQHPKPELGQAGASGEELGEQERQAEVQEGHGSHHQGIGSSLERQGKMHSQSLTTRPRTTFLPWLRWQRVPGTSTQRPAFVLDCKTPLLPVRAPPSLWLPQVRNSPSPRLPLLPSYHHVTWPRQMPGLSIHWQQQLVLQYSREG